jgi:hypothetical protein
MLDHVSDIAAAERFHDAIMKTLDIIKVGRRDDAKTARRANQQKPVQPSNEKYSPFAVGQIIFMNPPRPNPARGADRESSRTRDGMRWTRQRWRETVVTGQLRL